MTYRSSKSDHVCALCVSRRIKQKKVHLRNHNTCFFTCLPRPPTLSQRHMDLRVWSYPRPDYIFQVSSKSVQGFRSPGGGGQNLAFPITLASRFYNSLYYRTIRDICLCTTSWRQFKSVCHQNLPVIPKATGDKVIKFWKVKGQGRWGRYALY